MTDLSLAIVISALCGLNAYLDVKGKKPDNLASLIAFMCLVKLLIGG